MAWPLYVGATWLWHTPRAYELALNDGDWHVTEHACFLITALLFWFPVVRPYPSRPRWSLWLLIPYLLLADVQNTVLAAWLTFSNSVLYPHYAQVPRLAGLSALDDQAAAGVIMWVPGSIVFLLPLFAIGIKLLFGSHETPRRKMAAVTVPPRPDRWQRVRRSATPSFDLLRLPLVGSLLRWRWSRRVMQGCLLVLAVVVIFDGLRGPQLGALNLAGVLPWIHWRGLLIFGLLIAGNVFCMACPFTLPRTIARRWLPGGKPWPRYLRSKWLAVGLMVLFLWSYDAFALWDSPWLTAWIAIGYFVGAFAVDAIFREAAFCKYVCPIGQFNFVQSLVSPWEVKVRQPTICASCHTHECIRGSATLPGCELLLFQPRKQGNLDCTFCLDCVHACPHENVGVLATIPGQTLWSDPFRSGIGRFGQRPDVAALVLVLVFGAFANAAGMVSPVVAWQERLNERCGGLPQFATTTLYYAATLLCLPLITVACVAVPSRAWGRLDESRLQVATQFSVALVPLGFSMWAAHYSFHFLTSCDTIVPVTQRFLTDAGWPALGRPLWQSACCRPAPSWLPYAELLLLDVGLLLSLYTGLRIAELHTARPSRAWRAAAPWSLLIVALFAVGVWIVFQPMQMRGMLPAAG